MASSKSTFNFGQLNTSTNQTQSTFQFGGGSQDSKTSNQIKKQALGGNDENKPLVTAFNFNGSQVNSEFKFGNSNNANETPLKLQSLQSQPSGSTFVFGGLPANQVSTDSPNLTQILAGPPTTPSTTGRPIKKATRMRKK